MYEVDFSAAVSKGQGQEFLQVEILSVSVDAEDSWKSVKMSHGYNGVECISVMHTSLTFSHILHKVGRK